MPSIDNDDNPTGLEPGVGRFQAGPFAEHRDLFAELATGQSPSVMFITCADSRIDPSLITQTLPGDLFICRNAGNIVPPYTTDHPDGMIASIEYAVTALGVSHIVVCGHSSCGAMGALLSPPEPGLLPAVETWLTLATAASGFSGSLEELIEANAAEQLKNLRTHPAVDKAVSSGALTLHAWVYDIGSGGIRAQGPDGAFASLAAP